MRSHRAELDFAGGGRSAASQRAVDPLAALLGESAPMQQLRASITAAAETASTVLLCGETGTGKGVAARAFLVNGVGVTLLTILTAIVLYVMVERPCMEFRNAGFFKRLTEGSVRSMGQQPATSSPTEVV